MDDPRREPGGPLSGRPPEADRYGPPTDGPPYSRHRRHGHSRGTPPPWWPQDEPWPPPGGWRTRRRFVRRIALLLIGFILLMVLLSSVWNAFGPHVYGVGPNLAMQRAYNPVRFLGPLLVIVLVGGYVAWRVLRRTAAPVGDVMEAADRVAAGDYATRVDPRGSDEVRRLADSFNEMTRRLQLNEEQRRALLADVAHELRTPLSVVRGNVEGMLDGVIPRDDERLASLLAATQRMTRLLEDLQTLSTAQAGVLHLHREPTDPRRLVDDVVRAFAPLAGERGVSLTAQADGAPELEADPMRLRQVLDNLVANAVRYTPQGGSVVVHSWRAGDDVLFAVADSGRGMAPDELAHLFERFSKSADSKGSGLGLAIARSLVESHGGQIAAQSEPGHGTTITFRLPLTPPR